MRRKTILKSSAAILTAAAGLIFASCSPGPEYYAKVGDTRIDLEIAVTPEARMTGLMFRDSLEENSGMLFIFPEKKVLSFWMRNTYIPLDIAFIDDSGRIIKIASMRPLDETSVGSGEPVRYALEVNKGFFRRNSISEGERVRFSEPVKEAEAR